MTKIKVIAGDWPCRSGQIGSDCFALPQLSWVASFEAVAFSQLSGLRLATEDTVMHFDGQAGWAMSNDALFGPNALLTRLSRGKNSGEVAFVASFIDGRKLVGSTSEEGWRRWECQPCASEPRLRT